MPKTLVKQRKYRERAQPDHRTHLGALEKKKDYVLRARNHEEKEKRMKQLKRRAALKNPDEYNKRMSKAVMKEGKHIKFETEPASTEKQKINMMSQDLNYLRLNDSKDKKKIEKLQENLHFAGGKAVNKHTIFVDEEKQETTFDPAQYFDTTNEIIKLGTTFRPRKSQLKDSEMDIQSAYESTYHELSERILRRERIQKLTNEIQFGIDSRKLQKVSHKVIETENGGKIIKTMSIRKR
eukprot:TRINITY_DN1931_c0_g1_i1.p2 TRINITY_DN1931_c0_g1~~TRINITY_DN1931_c0_g1_i1.p2  ORF type:complete len:238 (+),score=68.36 TRINITY_DN1931_c0_g1_i1:1475-2188(+)